MKARRGEMFTAVITDGRKDLSVTFFKAWGHEHKLVPGAVGVFVGAVSRFRDRWQLTHPEYEILGRSEDGWRGEKKDWNSAVEADDATAQV